MVCTGLERHDAFLHRGITRALADTVDRALDLVNARFHACQRVCNCHAEVVVHVAGQHDVFNPLRVLTQVTDTLCVFLRHHIADRVRDVDRRRARLDCGLDHAAEEVQIRAGCILSGKLHITAVLLCVSNVVCNRLDDLVRRHLKLILHMQRRSGQEGMNAGGFRTADRVPRSIDILFHTARQRADRGAADVIRDRGDRRRVSGRRNCKARFNDIHLERFQLPGNLDFFVQVHAAAWGLLAVAQGGVKNTNRSTHFLVLTFRYWGCTGTKKASSLNQTLRDEAKLRGTTLVAAYTATTQRASINAPPP